MPGRVLNFTEFSDKYSNGSTEPASVDDIKNAAANFEEGFDEETYDQPQIGPNRPVAGNYEMTPAKPGEEGSAEFSVDNTEEMNAPKEDEETSLEPLEEPAESNEEGETEQEEGDAEEDEKEEGNPEAGANPKKKVEEGITLVKGFAQFVNEEHGDYPSVFDEEDYMSDEDDYDHEEEEDDTCKMCGEVPISNEYGYSCGCNM